MNNTNNKYYFFRIKTQSEGVTKHEFECSYCLEVFKSKIEITCHRQLKHEKNTYKCPAYNCHNEYRTEFHRDKHYEVEHYKSSIASPRAMYLCKHCPSVFFKQNHLEKHTEDEHAHIRGRKPRVDKMPTKTKKQRLLKKIAQKRINEKKIIQKPQKKVIIRKKISKKSAVEMEDLLSDMSDGSTTEEEIMEDESELGNVYQIKKENEESPYQCIVID